MQRIAPMACYSLVEMGYKKVQTLVFIFNIKDYKGISNVNLELENSPLGHVLVCPIYRQRTLEDERFNSKKPPIIHKKNPSLC